MKLWLQGLILIGLPLGLQLIFAIALIATLQRIDTAATQETTSKTILSTCQELKVIVESYTVFELAGRYISPGDTADRGSVKESLSKKLRVLDSFSNSLDDKSKFIVDQFRQDIAKLMFLMDSADTQFSGVGQKVAMSRFVKESEYFEELMASIKSLIADDRQIQKHFSPIAEEFSPKALEGRQTLRILITAGLLCTVLMAYGLAVFYGKNYLSRFKVLLGNIKLFSGGSTAFQHLSGEDELAELGRSFNEMAEARLRAEEFRTTMLELVSHDLRSPLSSCTLTLSSVLEKEGKQLSPSVLRSLRRVNADLERLVRMADTLLTVGKLEQDKIDLVISAVNISKLIEPTLNAVRGIADVKGIGIEVDGNQDLLIRCDPDKVIQILVNLLSNSIKFAPDESLIVIHVSVRPDAYRFEIVDQGPGISADVKDKLFQKFSQLDQPPELKSAGSGLGLYISRLLVTAHGGTIGCTCPPEGGACFWFELLPGNEAKTPSSNSQ